MSYDALPVLPHRFVLRVLGLIFIFYPQASVQAFRRPPELYPKEYLRHFAVFTQIWPIYIRSMLMLLSIFIWIRIMYLGIFLGVLDSLDCTRKA